MYLTVTHHTNNSINTNKHVPNSHFAVCCKYHTVWHIEEIFFGSKSRCIKLGLYKKHSETHKGIILVFITWPDHQLLVR